MATEHLLILGFGLAALFGWLFWMSERLDRMTAQDTAADYRRKWLQAIDVRDK